MERRPWITGAAVDAEQFRLSTDVGVEIQSAERAEDFYARRATVPPRVNRDKGGISVRKNSGRRKLNEMKVEAEATDRHADSVRPVRL